MKIALIGYGKMGRMIEQAATDRGHEITCRIDVENLQDFESKEFREADVAIEFTAPTAAYENIKRAFAVGQKVVSGSTGWFAAHEEEMRRLCSAEGGGHTLLWASNFSIGVAIARAANKHLAQLMSHFPDYSPRMEEVHHVHKADAPSGTAITLAEEACEALGGGRHWAMGELTQPDGSVVPAPVADDARALYIDARRRDEVPGTHTISYTSAFDTITLQHEAHTRAGFALGAVVAAEFVQAHQGLLSVDEVWEKLFNE